MNQHTDTRLDNFIQNDAIAAIVMRQNLKPVEGDHAVIFPPTYAGIGYNIDKLDLSGEIKTVCTIDSVGSQANRMEPIFKKPPYSDLIPRIKIEIRKQAPRGEEIGELIDEVDLLDAGHRIADAVVRFSDGAEEIETAFEKLKKGDASAMAKLAPTSLVFGCWDSRGSSVKLPRIVRSAIRAYNAYKLTRSAQYVPATENYEEAFVKLSDKERNKFSKAGMNHALRTGEPGGVILDSNGYILKEAVLSLSALRALQAQEDEATMKLQRYILGLSLVSLTAPQDPLLRMGCELTADPDRPGTWEQVNCDGTRAPVAISHDDAIAFAKQAAEEFGVGKSKTFIFDPKIAKEALHKKDKEDEGK